MILSEMIFMEKKERKKERKILKNARRNPPMSK